MRAAARGKGVEDDGRLVAAALAGAWRSPPMPLALSPTDIASITPLLLRAGSGALAWWRIRHSDLKDAAGARPLRDTYRYDTLQAGIHERHITQAVDALRSFGVDPLLLKGWAAARLYPERGLRPYGDIDLCVRPEQYEAAVAALAGRAAETGVVDLHEGLPDLYRPSLDEVYDRSWLCPLLGVEVRTLGFEDHLRYMCLHLLRHGAYRAIWLCDIAAALESAPQDFDWEYLLRGEQRQSGWIICALMLAHDLLGAKLDGTVAAESAKSLPRWLVPAVVKQWGAREHYMASSTMAASLRSPRSILKALRLRWPNPVQATVGVGGRFSEFPRFPFQLGECLLRTAHFVTQAPRLIRQRSLGPVGRGAHAPVTARGHVDSGDATGTRRHPSSPPR